MLLDYTNFKLLKGIESFGTRGTNKQHKFKPRIQVTKLCRIPHYEEVLWLKMVRLNYSQVSFGFLIAFYFNISSQTYLMPYFWTFLKSVLIKVKHILCLISGHFKKSVIINHF